MKSKEQPDYLMQGKQPTVVLMTDKELLEILDILKELCIDGPNTLALQMVEKMERKFKQNK